MRDQFGIVTHLKSLNFHIYDILKNYVLMSEIILSIKKNTTIIDNNVHKTITDDSNNHSNMCVIAAHLWSTTFHHLNLIPRSITILHRFQENGKVIASSCLQYTGLIGEEMRHTTVQRPFWIFYQSPTNGEIFQLVNLVAWKGLM